MDCFDKLLPYNTKHFPRRPSTETAVFFQDSLKLLLQLTHRTPTFKEILDVEGSPPTVVFLRGRPTLGAWVGGR